MTSQESKVSEGSNKFFDNVICRCFLAALLLVFLGFIKVGAVVLALAVLLYAGWAIFAIPAAKTSPRV